MILLSRSAAPAFMIVVITMIAMLMMMAMINTYHYWPELAEGQLGLLESAIIVIIIIIIITITISAGIFMILIIFRTGVTMISTNMAISRPSSSRPW